MELGQDYQLFVGQADGPPETFVVIAGQTGLSRQNTTNLIDGSTKTSGQYGLQAPGRKQLTIQVQGKLLLPDANGLEKVHTLQKAYPQVANNFQIRKTPFAADDVVFEGSMFISNFSGDDPDQDNSTWSFQLTPAATPTVDLLAPA